MKMYFELYILDEDLSAEKWKKLYGALVSYLGVLGKFEVVFWCHENIVRFFVGANRDVSSLSNSLDGMLLRPVPEGELDIPKPLN